MTQPDGLPIPARYWAIATIALGITMAVIDSAIANVALPTIATDLHTDPAFSIWIVNGYQLAIMISLLPLSSFGDIVGYRRVYLGGLALFTIASLACAFSQTLLELSLSRVIQGFGAAGIMSVNIALVRFVYPHRLLGRGIGINAMVVAVHGFDIPSAILSALTFGALIGGIDALGHGEGFPLFLLEMIAASAVATVLVRRQLSSAVPLLPVDLLRIPIFALSVGTSICSFAAQMLALVSLPFLLQLDFHYSAVQTGLLLTPWPIGTGIAAPIAGRLSDRYSAGALGGIGLAVFAMGLLSLAFLPAHPHAVDIVWRMALAGAGFGLFQSPNNRAMLGAAPRTRSGGASGMLGTARLLGQTTGAAIVALLFARVPHDATTVALLMATGFALMAAFVSLLRLYEPLADAKLRSSNPEADPAMRADVLRAQAQSADVPTEP